jgi:hypothetical protein
MVISSIDGLERNALAAVCAVPQHHPAEGMQVVRGRDQAAGTGLETGCLRCVAAACLVQDHELSGNHIRTVADREPIKVRRRNMEAGVRHAERVEDAFVKERPQ